VRRRDVVAVLVEDLRGGTVQLGERNEVFFADPGRRRRHDAAVELFHPPRRRRAARQRVVERAAVAPRGCTQEQAALLRQPLAEATAREQERRLGIVRQRRRQLDVAREQGRQLARV